MSIARAQLRDLVLPVWGGKIEMHAKSAGQGPPVIYLHPAGGLDWDGFLDEMVLSHTVYALEHPGTSEGDPGAIEKVDSLWDLVLIYEEAIRALALETPPVCIGQSVGGMLAAELASAFPDLFSKLVLLAPAGLWRDDLAPREWLSFPPEETPTRLFLDPTKPEVAEFFAAPDDPGEALEIQVRTIWAIGCMAKFVWPIPDKGLRSRLHRVTAATLVVWGDSDEIMPVGYAEEFQKEISDCQVAIVPESGHVVQVEQRARVLDLVTEFLAG